jgi:hypothetical protein
MFTVYSTRSLWRIHPIIAGIYELAMKDRPRRTPEIFTPA